MWITITEKKKWLASAPPSCLRPLWRPRESFAPAHGLGAVLAPQQFCFDAFPVVGKVLWQCLCWHAVHTCRALVAHHPMVGIDKVLPMHYPTHQIEFLSHKKKVLACLFRAGSPAKHLPYGFQASLRIPPLKGCSMFPPLHTGIPARSYYGF